MALSVEQAADLVDLMADLGVDAEVRPDYSGRGMYGATCVAIVSDDHQAQIAMAYAAASVGIDFEDLPYRTDSMGLGVVIY